jgi:molecular chaperone GrpE
MDAEMVDGPDPDATVAGADNDPDTGVDPFDAVVAADAALTAEAATLVEHDIDAVLAERDEFKDIALRLQADFDNYRKRMSAQQADEIDRATGRIAESLLPVLDACEAAFAHGADGVEPVWSSLMGALQRQGLEALDITGQPFDPAVAEAVMHEAGDGGEPVVAEVLRTGYLWKGKVLRAAMVRVKG